MCGHSKAPLPRFNQEPAQEGFAISEAALAGGVRGVAPPPRLPQRLLGAVAVHIAGRTRLRSIVTCRVTSRARQRVQKLNTVSLLPHLT